MARRRRGEGRRERRTTTGDWHETPAEVPVEDAVIASALAQEALTPFGYRRPARELLGRFGGDPARATAALALAGVVADPPLDGAAPETWIQLRRAAPDAPAPPAPPARFAPPTPDAEAAPPVPSPEHPLPLPPEPAPDPAAPAPPPPRRGSWAQRTAAKHVPSGPATRERRVAAGALGLGALLVVLLVAVFARGALWGGDDDERLSEALPRTETARTAPSTTRAPSPPRPVAPPPSRPRARRRPRTVRLVIAPTEPSYVCIADGRTRATLFEGLLTGRWSATRASLILRVGVATARVGVNGRRLTIRSAPSAYLLTPSGVQGLPADRPVCGAG